MHECYVLVNVGRPLSPLSGGQMSWATSGKSHKNWFSLSSAISAARAR